jgi:hypothetical protein
MTPKSTFDRLIKPAVATEMTGPGQVAIMGRLCQSGAAWLVSLSPRTLRAALDAPRNADKTYSGRALVQWYALRQNPEAGLLDGNSEALERLRDAKARIALLDLQERQGALLPRADIHALMTRLGAILKGTGERLQRDHGAAALEILNEGLADFEHEMAAKFGEQTPAVEPEKPKRGRKSKCSPS